MGPYGQQCFSLTFDLWEMLGRQRICPFDKSPSFGNIGFIQKRIGKPC